MSDTSSNSNSNGSPRSEMQMLASKCSICFDNNYDFCLIRCQDQFCRVCFTRYAHEIVMNAWGLGEVEIRCPVCQDSLQKNEWLSYVSDNVRSLFNKHSRPFKTMIRACPQCGNENKLCNRFESTVKQDREIAFNIAVNSLQLAADIDDAKSANRNRIIKEMKDIFAAQMEANEDLADDDSVSRIYQLAFDSFFCDLENYELKIQQLRTAPDDVSSDNRRTAKKRARQSSDSEYISADTSISYVIQCMQSASHGLLALESSQAGWRNLQFKHLSKFPRSTCQQCQNKFCFQCGESGWHEGLSCMEYLTHLVDSCCDESVSSAGTESETTVSSSEPSLTPSPVSPLTPVVNRDTANKDERIATLRWKLANGKDCPRCHTLICREEGCNKVDCTMCGYRFCWVCKSSWGEKCGFYSCRAAGNAKNGDTDADTMATPPESPKNDREPSESGHADGKVENGVPDVRRISIRLST